MGLEKVQLLAKKHVLDTFMKMFDQVPEDFIDQLFKLYESKIFHSGYLKQELEGDKLSTLRRDLMHQILRTCKIIIGKLSITQDTGLRGRILKLNASVFDVTHPACTNKTGTINTTNETKIDEEKLDNTIMSEDEFREYRNFWKLQEYLSNPFNV